jgi:hypothetical protein
VRTIAYKEIAILRITCGEHEARCGCCKTFRTTPEGVLPKAKYDNKVRQAVLDGILEDQLNVEALRARLQRDFLLNLSTGFVYDCLYDAAKQLDLAQHRQEVIERFRGTLCVDEVHLGKFTLLLATDPIGDFPVAFALVSANDQDHLRRFLSQLQRSGLEPQVVISDGSNLYPAVLEQVWPEAQHQLCIFHVMQDLNKKILDALRRMRKRLTEGARKKSRRKRGRPKKSQRHRVDKAKQLKEKSSFVFKHRYLILKRRENLSDSEKKDLQQMLQILPELGVLRQFADKLYWLFEPQQSKHQAWCRWHTLQRNSAFSAIPELAKALESLPKEKFAKMIAYLGSCHQYRHVVRTNNHVERCNRKLRYWEKTRYKWRRRRTLVRYLVLALDRWWKRAFSQPPQPPPEPATANKAKAKKTDKGDKD